MVRDTVAEPRSGTLTLASAIAAAIHDAGIDRVFGVPGGEVLSLIEALRLEGTEFVLCNHESSAGMMAAAYGQLTGHPGVVLTTLGPGATNLLLPIANAQLDREALLAICGDLGESLPASHTHQRLDLTAIFAPTTKYVDQLTPEHGAARLRRAFGAVSSVPNGAALLTLSTEAAGATVPADPAGGNGFSPVTHDGVAGDVHADAASLRDALSRSQHPLVVVGCGADHAAARGLTSWLERWELPVALTPKAKGMVSDEYGRFVGVLDGAGLGSLMTGTLAEADLVLGLGLDPVELIRPWHATAPVIWAGNCGPEDELAPDARRLHCTVDSLVHALTAGSPPAEWPDWTRPAVDRRRALLEDDGLLTWIPRALRAALPADAVVTTDVGSHKCLISQFLAMDEPGRFLTSNGLSAMGYGLPAAIGAKLARPELPVVAVIGDGGFAMSAQELETAGRTGAHVVCVVLVDSSLSLIQQLQQARGLPRAGVDYGRIDVERIASGYGAQATTARTSGELEDAVLSALRADGPTVIAVPIDGDDYGVLL